MNCSPSNPYTRTRIELNMRAMHRITAWLCAALLALPLLALAADEAHSRKLSFDTTAKGGAIDANVNQLPVLVRLHSGNFTFAEARPDGSDLRFFADDDKTPLKFFIERFDATNELAAIWVSLPVLTANSKNDAIRVHWGKPDASPAGDSKAVFDASQILVLNFSDAQGASDATANANHAGEVTAKRLANGAIAGALNFDGKGLVVVPTSASLRLSGSEGLTLTAWIHPRDGSSGGVFNMGGGALTFELVKGVVITTVTT